MDILNHKTLTITCNHSFHELPTWFQQAKTKNAVVSYVGVFNEFDWYDGIWENGLFDIGTTWHNGIWKNGIWNGSEWRNGTWNDGRWLDGIWKNGIWISGKWQGGTWKNGIWLSGKFRERKCIGFDKDNEPILA